VDGWRQPAEAARQRRSHAVAQLEVLQSPQGGYAPWQAGHCEHVVVVARVLHAQVQMGHHREVLPPAAETCRTHVMTLQVHSSLFGVPFLAAVFVRQENEYPTKHIVTE
jgi:L-ascorbate metabolism protein UlaG (beta-lactamase superfamily)